MRPTKLNILGIEYDVLYIEKPSDVDVYGRQSLWGQVDPWTRTIRIYQNGRNESDINQTIWHEVLHAITGLLHIETITEAKDAEDVIDLLALAINDFISRNDFGK